MGGNGSAGGGGGSVSVVTTVWGVTGDISAPAGQTNATSYNNNPHHQLYSSNANSINNNNNNLSTLNNNTTTSNSGCELYAPNKNAGCIKPEIPAMPGPQYTNKPFVNNMVNYPTKANG